MMIGKGLIALSALALAACGRQDQPAPKGPTCPIGCEAVQNILYNVPRTSIVKIGTPPHEEGPPPLPTETKLCRFLEEDIQFEGCRPKHTIPPKPVACPPLKAKLMARRLVSTWVMPDNKGTCTIQDFPPIRRNKPIEPISLKGGTLLIEDIPDPGNCPTGTTCKSLRIDPIFTSNFVSIEGVLPPYLKVQHTQGRPFWYVVGKLPAVTAPTTILINVTAKNGAGQASASFPLTIEP